MPKKIFICVSGKEDRDICTSASFFFSFFDVNCVISLSGAHLEKTLKRRCSYCSLVDLC